jgi:hypothetical protein
MHSQRPGRRLDPPAYRGQLGGREGIGRAAGRRGGVPGVGTRDADDPLGAQVVRLQVAVAERPGGAGIGGDGGIGLEVALAEPD